jgi:hypothetical protein
LSGHAPEEWEDLEPQREWTTADRWRMAAWVLIFLNVLGLLVLAPAGDSGLAEAAAASGADDGPARMVFWLSLLGCTVVGNGIGAAAAATKQRWAIVPPVLAAVGCWAGFFIAQALV